MTNVCTPSLSKDEIEIFKLKSGNTCTQHRQTPYHSSVHGTPHHSSVWCFTPHHSSVWCSTPQQCVVLHTTAVCGAPHHSSVQYTTPQQCVVLHTTAVCGAPHHSSVWYTTPQQCASTPDISEGVQTCLVSTYHQGLEKIC